VATSPWDLLRHDQTDAAIRRLRENYRQEASTSRAMDLGVAYLWLRRYDAAFEHFSEFSERHPHHNVVTYGMAGTAKWCLGDSGSAVEQWREGLKCKFTDWAGGVDLPMLLYFASIARPVLVERCEARQILQKRLANPLATRWPAPLGHYMMDEIDEEELRRKCEYEDSEEVVYRNQWADFVVGVKALENGRTGLFAEVMNRACDVSWRDYDASDGLFWSKIWHEAFYLARYEAHSQ
jgi:hypothetical protein